MKTFRRTLVAMFSVGIVAISAGVAFGQAQIDSIGSMGAKSDYVNRTLDDQPVEATSEVLVFLKTGADAEAFAADHGLTVKHGLQSDPNSYVFEAASSADAAAMAGKGFADVRVNSVYLNERSQNVRYAFTPNDPLYSPTGGFGGQWHLRNQIGTGVDANVIGAWNRDITGSGVVIGIVDDCLQKDHPDLSPNYSAANSFNFGSYVGRGAANDPSPYGADDMHGTSVAGVAAARGGNGIGVTGAAPYASLAGLRVDFAYQTTAQFVDATLYHSSGANTTIKVKNHSYGIGSPYIRDSGTTAERTALNTSTLAGTIHCLAAGNDRGTTGEDANKKHMQSSPDAIAVAALGANGKFSSYSNYGSCVFVAAPSNGYVYGITTTDLVGSAGYNATGLAEGEYSDLDYTAWFGGTSSATPLVTGVMALAKQAQPNLNTRFAKHLMVRTSTLVDSTDNTVSGGGDGSTSGSAWKTNAAGYKFNQNYGFGLINANALTQQAVNYVGVTPLQTYSTGTLNVSQTIPDASATGVTRTVNITQTTPLEEILVSLSVSHAYQGDLTAWITSPSGTTSRLFSETYYASGNMNWQFCDNAFWGENPYGAWTLKVADVIAADQGTWNAWSMDLRMGTLVAVPEPTTLAMVIMALALVGIYRRRGATK